MGQLFERLLKTPRVPRRVSGWGLKGLATRFFVSRQLSKLSETERQLVADFRRLFSDPAEQQTAQPLMDDRRTFRIACHISHTLGYNFLRRFIEFARQGKLMESLQTIASLAPVALSMAPYLAAFNTQHKDERFHKAVAAHFPAAAHLRRASDHKAWITDTFAEVNGVSRTIQVLAQTARKTGRKLVVLTSMEKRRRPRTAENRIGPDGNRASSHVLAQVPDRPEEFPARGDLPAAGVRIADARLSALPGNLRVHRAAPLQRIDHFHARPDGPDRPGRGPPAGPADDGHLPHRFRASTSGT